MYWHNEALSHPEDKAQLNIHRDLWVDPGKQFTGSGTIVHLADNSGIIPLGSFHHCHFSSPWLMFPRSPLFLLFFYSSAYNRGPEGTGAEEAWLITKGKQRVIDWLVNKRLGQAAAEEKVPGEPSLLIFNMQCLHPSYLIITVTGRYHWFFKIRCRIKPISWKQHSWTIFTWSDKESETFLLPKGNLEHHWALPPGLPIVSCNSLVYFTIFNSSLKTKTKTKQLAFNSFLFAHRWRQHVSAELDPGLRCYAAKLHTLCRSRFEDETLLCLLLCHSRCIAMATKLAWVWVKFVLLKRRGGLHIKKTRWGNGHLKGSVNENQLIFIYLH